MKLRKITRMGLLWTSLGLVAMAAGCETDKPKTPEPLAPPTIEPDIEPVDVTASFTLTVDTANPALDEVTLEPKSAPITVEGGTEALGLKAFVKRLPARPGILWIELYFENKQAVGLKDVDVAVGALAGANELYEFTNSPLADPTAERTFNVGRIAAEGMSRIALGIPKTSSIVKLPLTLSGITTKRTATSSSPIVITPDGKEVWAASPDGNSVSVIDTATDTRVAQIPIEGHPSSVGVTPDSKLIVISSAWNNTVTVVDRQTRKVLQSLGEADGLGRELRNLIVSPDGGRVFVSGYVSDTITSLIRNGDRYRVEGNIAVGRRPTGLALGPDGENLFVAHFLPRGKVLANEGWISVVSVASQSVVKDVRIDDPLNLSTVKCLADIFGVHPSRMTAEGAPSQLAGMFLNPAGTMAWTPGTRIAGATIIWEKGPNSAPLSPIVQLKPAEIAAPFIYLFDTRDPLAVEHMRLPALDPPDVKLDYIACSDLALEIEVISRNIIPSAPDQQVNRAAAFPSPYTGMSDAGLSRFIGFTRGGRRSLVISHGSDEIVVTDALSLYPTSQLHFQLSGSNPVAIGVTPDGKKGYVLYENSTFASVLDLSAYASETSLPGPSYIPYEYRDVPDFPSAQGPLTNKRLVRHIKDVPEYPPILEASQITLLDEDPLSSTMRRGRVLFNSSNPTKHPTLTASRLGACGTCHPGGGNDGTLWATMEGERRTMSLVGGVAGRGWLHASGTHVDAHEFADIIVKERLGGSLSAEDTNALAEYVARGIPRLQSPKVDAPLAAKGKTVFQQKCSGCHMGEAFTSGNPDPNNEWGGGLASGPTLYDVGTVTDDAHVILGTFFESILPPLEGQLFKELRGDRDLGPDDFVQQTLDFRPRPERKGNEFKAPALTNVWDNVVFFHDGRYDKMEDVVKYFNTKLNLNMTDDDQKAVIEYLKTL